MQINGQQLQAIDVERITNNIFGDTEHKKRIISIANAALGVVSSASLIIHRIGRGLASSKNLLAKHAIKQVDRLLSNKKFNVWNNFPNWISYVVGARKEIVIAMDWTDFDGDKQSTIAINLVTSHGRATPLIWKTVYKSKLKNKRNDYEDEIIERLRDIIPEDVKVTVLADRGFGDIRLYEHLMDNLKFHFVIRFRGNIHVTNDKGEQRKAQEWAGKNGRAKTLRNARVTNEQYIVPTVVCVKAKNMKEPWCIASSDPEGVGSIIVKWYSKRWGIEPQFRDTKDIHFGMGLSATSIGTCERRDRLLFISALSVMILTILGAAGEQLGMDRYLKANTVKHRTHSLFNQGCYYFSRIINMEKKELQELLQCFSKLIEDKKSLQDILWVI